jgi:hypothetical protein
MAGKTLFKTIAIGLKTISIKKREQTLLQSTRDK